MATTLKQNDVENKVLQKKKKNLADNIFKFDENNKKFAKPVENTKEKG